MGRIISLSDRRRATPPTPRSGPQDLPPAPEAGPQEPPPAADPDATPTWTPPTATAAEVLAGTACQVGALLAAPLLADRVRQGMSPIRPKTVAPEAASGVRDRVPGGAPSGADRSTDAAADLGWFGPDSVAWTMHADPCLLVAGMTAFALQSLHPLALAGVADHSSFATDFLGRVLRTGMFVQGVVYGTSAEAEAHCARVRHVHERVVGTAPDGRPYRADDPELLTWVHLTEYAAIAACYRRFGAWPLSVDRLDRYVDEVSRVGAAMDVPAPPHSWAELEAGLQRFRPQLAVGDQARTAVSFLRHPPGLPDGMRAAWSTLWAGGVACLPPFAARLYHLPAPGRLDLIGCRSLLRALAPLLGEPPALAAARARAAR